MSTQAGRTTSPARYSRRLLVSIAAVALLTLPGVLRYHYIEDYSYLDSLYMVVITFTTVGYGTIGPLSPAGTVLTILIVVFGMATGLNLLAIGAEYIMEGHLAGTIKKRRIERVISRLSGHYVVCGYRRMGQGVVNELLAIKRGDDEMTVTPDSDWQITARDDLAVVGPPDQLTEIAAGASGD